MQALNSGNVASSWCLTVCAGLVAVGMATSGCEMKPKEDYAYQTTAELQKASSAQADVTDGGAESDGAGNVGDAVEPATDSGAPTDIAADVSGDSGADTASPADAGSTTDSGGPADAGPQIDAGAVADAGAGDVTTVQEDAGDTTAPVDSGPAPKCATSSQAKDCDDSNICTDDLCQSGACVSTNNAKPCDDGNACTSGDSCNAGKCSPGVAKKCDDGVACTTSTCETAKGECVHTPSKDGTACDDGDGCTEAEACAAGKCAGGKPKACDDDNPCTENDGCAAGKCVPGKMKSCDDGNKCTVDACGKTTGCAHSNGYDGSLCLEGKTCSVGVCKALVVTDGKVTIPMSPFWMGRLSGGSADEKPMHKVDLDSYKIDIHEVTVAKYKACVDAGKCTAPKKQYENQAGRTPYTSPKFYNWNGPADRINHPVNGVDWTQAKKFCESVGGRLPTEAEWEKAAKGGCDAGQSDEDCKKLARPYPWGSAYPKCDYATMLGTDPKTKINGSGCGKWSTAPVGSLLDGKSLYGLFDMAGNVEEWVADWYGYGYYTTGPPKNPKGPSSGTERVLRGGHLNSNADNLNVTRREYESVEWASFATGFRCAY